MIRYPFLLFLIQSLLPCLDAEVGCELIVDMMAEAYQAACLRGWDGMIAPMIPTLDDFLGQLWFILNYATAFPREEELIVFRS